MKKHTHAALIVSWLAINAAYSQSVFNNQSVISIGPSDILFVKDSIINNGTIVNNGNVQLGGSWINNAQYDAGDGQITFNSDLPQVINHNDQSFSRLTISGGGEKLFLADITVEEELNLSDGILVSQNNARIILSDHVSITGGSDQAHIDGPVYHLGEGARLYPVGNGTVYLPVTLLNVEGADANVGVQEHELDGVTLHKTASLSTISAKRYWQLDVLSGSVEHSQVMLSVRDENISGNGQQFVAAEAPDITANFETLGQSRFDGTSANGQITSSGVVTHPILAVGMESADGQIVVYNAVSANGDALNDFLHIGNIERYPENKFTLFNRWGDKIFEIENYDNRQRVFRGRSNINGEKDLVNGTYYYVLETKKDGLKINGFLTLKK